MHHLLATNHNENLQTTLVISYLNKLTLVLAVAITGTDFICCDVYLLPFYFGV